MSASASLVMAPTSASRARTAAGPAATCSPTAAQSPIRPARFASPDSISSTGDAPAGSSSRSFSEHRGRNRRHQEDATPMTPTPRGPHSHLREVE